MKIRFDIYSFENDDIEMTHDNRLRTTRLQLNCELMQKMSLAF